MLEEVVKKTDQGLQQSCPSSVYQQVIMREIWNRWYDNYLC